MTTKEQHEAAFKQAMDETGRYVATRWSMLPKEVQRGVAITCLAFQRLTDEEKLTVLLVLHRQATVLAIDRANQVADLSVASEGAQMAA